MTAANERLHPAPTRTALPPAQLARLVLWTVVGVNVLIVELVFLTAEAAKNPILGFGKWLGLHLALIMVLQLVLVARLPWLDRRIGMDRLTSWHRWTGFSLFWLVLLHPAFVLLGYANEYNSTPLTEFNNLKAQTPVLLGIVAAVIILVAAGLSVRAARRRLSYEAWHAVHICLYVAVVLGLIHQMFEVSTFTSTPLATAYWWALWAFALVSLVAGRVVMPLWRNARHQFRVAAVVPEAGNVTSVYVTGKDLDKLPARAGQFMIWRFPGHGHWWDANPFSLSAAPDGRTLRLTAKAVGSASAKLRDIPVGTRVFAEGPYGAFTSLSRTRESTLLIAGGVGITPIRALLEELTGPVTVLYRAHTTEDAVLLGELQNLARSRGAQLHLLTGRTGAGSPPNNPFDPQNLSALVPDIHDRDVYVCGPAAMTNAVLRSLRTLRLPTAQIHSERFSLAG
ncbi:ferredoxin reductase family protein [Actinoplanes friuliensis]|uniref:Putative oxidoreductase n=1 Tax=Actinoplanes friuliensis DSM 7358 TaxID=1246995 RepID=U5W2M9_9ACTN|nr:ferredoxin reductase family protein [Actinoplanes friuliensis]AGZ42235.1 putative oxidoreductase [Actinoplanes friuliensis DSM 7358]